MPIYKTAFQQLIQMLYIKPQNQIAQANCTKAMNNSYGSNLRSAILKTKLVAIKNKINMNNIRQQCSSWLIGCISGLSVVLTSATLNFWLAKNGVSINELGLFTLIALPYSINFIWIWALDQFKLPIISQIFGQHLAWTILLQLLISILVLMLSYTNPANDLATIAILAFFIALLSSTNDNILGAIRSQLLPAAKQGISSGSYVFGYRIGMMLCNSGAIYLSCFCSWRFIYQLISLSYIVFLLLLIALLPKMAIPPKAQELSFIAQSKQPTTHAMLKLQEFKSHILRGVGNSYKMLGAILTFLILYRIGDNFINAMINPFLLELNFSTAQIATTGKLCASIGTIIGGLIGSYYMRKRSIINSLLFFGIIHTSAHLLLALLAVCGNNMLLYFITSLSESVTGGMAMSAYIAFIASLCKGKYRATGQAFFNSTMGLSRSILPSISGLLANYCGWSTFFLIAFLISIPSLILLEKIRNKLQHILSEES